MKKILLFGISLLFVACAEQGGLLYAPLDMERAKEKAQTYINTVLSQDGSIATVTAIAEDGDLYKLTISIPEGDNVIESYMTKDGKKFFPQALDMDVKIPEDSQ